LASGQKNLKAKKIQELKKLKGENSMSSLKNFLAKSDLKMLKN